MSPPADRQTGRILVELAYASVVDIVVGQGGDLPAFGDLYPWLAEPAATFVTLRHRGLLRGCVGSLAARLPLADDVQHNARAAATRDSRFAPIAGGELADLDVEISLLSSLEDVTGGSEEEVLSRIRVGIDGVVLELGAKRSTFLPQVWSSLPQPRQFFARLKEKAGLPPEAWSTSARVWSYTVDKWKRSDFADSVPASSPIYG